MCIICGCQATNDVRTIRSCVFFSFDNTGVTTFHPFSPPKKSKTLHKMALFLSWLGWVVLARQLNRLAADKGLEENVDDFVKVNF